MGGLEKHVQIQAGLVALVLLKHSGNNRAWETWLSGDKRESLGRQDAGIGLLGSRSVANRRRAASDYEDVRRHGHADGRGETVKAIAVHREPPAGIEQITGVVADIGQLEAGHGAIVGTFQRAVILDRKSVVEGK